MSRSAQISAPHVLSQQSPAEVSWEINAQPNNGQFEGWLLARSEEDRIVALQESLEAYAQGVMVTSRVSYIGLTLNLATRGKGVCARISCHQSSVGPLSIVGFKEHCVLYCI